MNYNEIVSVSKLPGLYQIHKQRADGLIVKSLVDDKILFAASRAHSFTPLENITIYTDTDPIELLQVLINMKSEKTVPSAKSSSDELKSYFQKIVPNYDTDRVYVSDIQKIIKWYNLLADKDVIKPKDAKQKEAKGESNSESTESVEAKVEEKPKAKKKAAPKKKEE